MTALAPEPRTRAAVAARWWPTLLGCLLLALAVYLPTALRAGFVNFDDNFYFGPDNPEFREGLLAVLDPRRSIANVYLPVSHVSLWLDFKLGGGPLLPHLTSLLLHALAAFALVRAFLQLGIGALPAHLAGALFLLHPALAETVAWVSSRKDVLAGLFVFIALGAAAKYARRPGAGRLVWIAGLTVLAMYSKATAVVLPLLLLLVALYVGGDRRRFLAPLVSLLVTLPIAWHHQVIAAAEGTMVQGGTIDRLAQVPGALVHYLATAFAPQGLNVLYPEVKTLAAFRSGLLPCTAVLIVLLALAAWLWRRAGTAAAGFGLAAMLVALLPFNTAFPASAIAAADRYLYLAVPGAALAVAVLVARLPRPVAVAAAAAVLPLFLLSLSLMRAPAFACSADLWRASLDADADNAVAHMNLVADLSVREPFGAVAEKRAHLEAAIAAARYPVHELNARERLLLLLLSTGDLEGACTAAQAAVAAAERMFAAETSRQRRQLAAVRLLQTLLEAFEPLRQAKQFDAARAVFQRAKEIAPTHPDVIAADALLQLQEVLGRDPAAVATDARAVAVMDSLRAALSAPGTEYHRGLNIAMGMWQAATGNSLWALKHLRRAIDADPTASEAYVQAAAICRRNGLYDTAEGFARDGRAHVQAKDPRLLYELALARAGQEGGIDDGIQFLEAYVATAPKDRDAARMLSSFLCSKAIAGMGDRPEAEQEQLIGRALAYNPGEPRVDIIQGRICRNHRRFQEAVEHLERAHAALPAFEDATAMLAQSYFDLGYEKRYSKPPDIDGAVAAWQKFLALGVKDLDPAGVRMQLEALWRSNEAEGVDKLKAGDRAAAAACFRRCLRIDDSQHWASWLLATALFDQPGTDLQELDRLLQQSIAWQQKNQLDRSRPVLLRVLTLQRLGQEAAAQKLGDDYLQAPDADADAEAMRRLQRTLAR